MLGVAQHSQEAVKRNLGGGAREVTLRKTLLHWRKHTLLREMFHSFPQDVDVEVGKMKAENVHSEALLLGSEVAVSLNSPWLHSWWGLEYGAGSPMMVIREKGRVIAKKNKKLKIKSSK